MSTDLERKIDRLIDKMDVLVTSGGRTSSSMNYGSGATAIGGGFELLFDKLGRGLGNVFNTAGGYLEKAYANQTGPQDLSNAITKTISQLGGPFEVLGRTMGGISSVILDSYQNWKAFSGLGLQMGGDFMALNTAIKRTGLTVQEFGEQFDNIGSAARNLGVGFTQAIQEFGRISQMQDNTKFADQFRLLGMMPKDVNSALTLVIKSLDMNARQMNADQLMESTMRLSREMDAMAKLTGKSRQEQEAMALAVQNDYRYRARMSELRETNPEGAAAAGELATKLATQVGPELQSVISEGIANQGVFYSDEILKFQNTYGPEASRKLGELTRDIQSSNAEVREKALKDSQFFAVELMQLSKRNRQLTASGAIDDEIARGRYAPNSPLENLDKTIQGLRREGGFKDNTDVYTEALRRINLEQEGKIAVLTDEMVKKNALAMKEPGGKPIYVLGEDNPDAKLGRAIGAVESNQLRFNKGLNEMVEVMIQNTTKLVNMDTMISHASMYYKKGTDKAGDPVMGSQLTQTMEAIKIEISNLDKIPEGWAGTIADAVAKKLNIQGNSGGTIGETGGDYFRNFGSGQLRMLHGMEGVFRPDQADAYANQKFSSIIPNLSSLLRNVETKISSDSPVSSQVMEQLASGADAAMNLSAEKLDAISSLLAANLNELKEIARHTSNTSDNISNAGGYVS
jgi:hypothetical protein